MELESMDENIKNHRGIKRFRKNLSESNVLLMGFAMFLVFAAFNTSQNIATSISSTVGSYSLGILYSVNCIACLIAPNIINHHISCKTSIILGAISYAFFVASYIKVIDIVLYITSGILGGGAAFLWIGEGSFVTLCSNEFEYEFLLPYNSELGYFNGIFWFIFQFNQLIGNGAAGILKQFNVSNTILFIILTVICFIGCFFLLFLQTFQDKVRYFDDKQIQTFAKKINPVAKKKKSDSLKYNQIQNNDIENNNVKYDFYDQLSWDKSATYGDSAIVTDKMINDELMKDKNIIKGNNSILDNQSSVLLYHEYHKIEKLKKTVDPILTVKMWFTANFLIVFPISIYSGVTQGFQFGDFGALINSDSHTFFALAAFGFTDAIFSNIFGRISDKVGRLPIIFVAICSHASVYIFLFFYHVPQDDLWKFLIIGGILGIGDAGFNTQIYALYPILLGDRPESFANFNFWQSAASAWCFYWHSHVSIKVKTATYLGVLILAAIPLYGTSRGRNAARSKKSRSGGH